MQIQVSYNTCSQAELTGISADSLTDFAQKLKDCIQSAKNGSRKSIIANCNEGQHERYGKSLTNAKFVYVGKYYGNSLQYVHVYIYGLTPVSKPAIKRTLIRKVKKAISR